MGVVFRAEHILMRRVVAIKVLPLSRDQDARLLLRFLAEMRTVASLQHPNIVTAMDAGQINPTEPNLPVMHYLVMEFVAGNDLEELIIPQGPLDVARAGSRPSGRQCARRGKRPEYGSSGFEAVQYSGDAGKSCETPRFRPGTRFPDATD